MAWISLSAKYAGTCQLCLGKISPGQAISWHPQSKLARHASCPKRMPAEVPVHMTSTPKPGHDPLPEPNPASRTYGFPLGTGTEIPPENP